MSAVASALSQGAGRATLARHAAPRNTTSHAAAHRTRLAVTASAVPPATPKLAVITGANTGTSSPQPSQHQPTHPHRYYTLQLHPLEP